VDGQRRARPAEALGVLGAFRPLELAAGEGLALINGTQAMIGGGMVWPCTMPP
jgi:histidine ammonia-lyase